jgi:hypothetical protein
MKQKMRHRLSEGFSLEAIAEEFETTTLSVILGLLSDGLSPSQIAKQSGIPTSSLIQQIHTAIGAGCLLRSEVYATLNKDWLKDIDLYRKGTPKFIQRRPLGLTVLDKKRVGLRV